MLTADDTPTIENAIRKRLAGERDVRDVTVFFGRGDDCVHVGVIVECGSVALKSRFDLPLMFDHSQLVDEIDEVAEGIKAAMADYWRNGRVFLGSETPLPGTGLRGRWGHV